MTTTLYRPVGQPELELIAGSGWRRFPPRLDWQPIFYPVLTEAYATRIARDWNTKDPKNGNVGYVMRFEVDTHYLSQFDVQQVGGEECLEYWIPAEELATFNDHIVGEIAVVSTWRGERPSPSEEWSVHRLDSQITQLRIDWRTSLLLLNGLELVIESPYQLEVAAERWTLPVGEPHEVAPVLQLLRRHATEVRFTKTGRLELRGEPSFMLSVLPDDRYESWQLTLPDGALYVCVNEGWVHFTPGGTG